MNYHERLLNEVEWRKCRGSGAEDVSSMFYWMEHYAHIQHPQHGKILIPLRPAQKEILAAWAVERYSIVLKARQIGWSTLLALYSLWLSFFWPDQMIVLLSKGEREAMKLLEKATYAYDRMPDWMRARGPRRLTRNLKKLSFNNASTIESMPSKEDPGRSSTASLVGVDEWAFLDNPEEAWASIEPISDVGGRVIGLSTANGSGNFFHKFWLDAEQGRSNFKPMFFPWHANTERDDNWYANKKRNMPGWQLAQEYPNDPEEAFIKSGNPVFDVDKLLKLETRDPSKGWLWWESDIISAPTFRTDGGGPISVWELPKAGHAYVIGADVAEGLEHGDYSSAHVIDVKTMQVVATWYGHIDPDEFGTQLAALGWFYNSAIIGCEINNHGLTTLTRLKNIPYPRLYYRKTLDELSQKWLTKLGWATTTKSKPLMIDALVTAIRDDELGVPDAATISELRTFVRDNTGATVKMHGSPHDDRVISLAIALQMVEYQYVPENRQEENKYWTLDWFKDMIKQVPEEGQPIGWFNYSGDKGSF